MKISDKWIFQRRSELLAKSSQAERAACSIITKLGYKVIQQYPINTGRKIYFADLYLPELHLIVEIDGGYHTTKNQKRLDRNRSGGMWRQGYHVCRLSNADARYMEKVRSKLSLFISKREK